MKVLPSTTAFRYPQFENQAAKLIKAYDADGDGAISRQEAAERNKSRISPDRFTALDTNQDGKLAASELADRYGRILDSNKDGKVSFWEKLVYKHGFASAIEDGRVDKPAAPQPPAEPQPRFAFPEFEKLARDLIKKYDKDGDGTISSQEAAAYKKNYLNPARFALLDEDKDGKLTAAELANRYGRILDSNKNGKVSIWEKLVYKHGFASAIEDYYTKR